MIDLARSTLSKPPQLIRSQVNLNLQFLARLITEDSFHYLFYSFFFILLSSPVSVIVLAPPALFALLHSVSFSIRLLTKAGLERSKVSCFRKQLFRCLQEQCYAFF